MEHKPFRVNVFLLRLLAAIFIVESGFLFYGLFLCSRTDPDTFTKVCPNIGMRTEKLFGVAIATTLSLLAGDKIISK